MWDKAFAHVNSCARSLEEDVHGDTSPEQRRRLLTDTATEYQIISQLYYIPDDANDVDLLTDTSFADAVWTWLSKSSMGLFILILSIIFAVSMLLYCIWRTVYAPDNQDTVLKAFMDGRHDADPTIVDVEANSAKERRKRIAQGALARSSSSSNAVEIVPENF